MIIYYSKEATCQEQNENPADLGCDCLIAEIDELAASLTGNPEHFFGERGDYGQRNL